ncbi:nucleotide sugar dehydrogenase [Defluviimonas sp. WL0002]|uniref:UDP-glucose 6-dehydrogenase n=1 Tax=Albidovulum marisflavi TaxID=2984159 RepID=A0ABT2ZCH1_9RHOB|nr:nucleotide sugar dehydrogenase [Defluviimonas sp. WL0002]MCV2868717.1 nucleotide sugar dehydrogenase [Defluviimonas sp. WL0002]
MRICVVGLGYVGLSNAVILAQHNDVVAVDTDPGRVASVSQRESPLGDPELAWFLANEDLRLTATMDLAAAAQGAHYILIATPTDYDPASNCFDTSSVEHVICSARAMNPDAAIVIRSTIPVGFVEHIRAQLNTQQVLFSPEFLRESHALKDSLHPSRIVVGERSSRARTFANLLCEGARSTNIPVLLTNPREAEAIKLFSNAYLAMRVAFFNELDSFALARGMNSRQIIEGVGHDPRIGDHYNNPSFGYGGYCLPKDTRQLLASYSEVPQNMIRAIVEANRTRMDFLADRISALAPGTVGIHRLVMKAGSDNYRHSPVLDIMSRLRDRGIEMLVHEPLLSEDRFMGARVIEDFAAFKELSDVIIANRVTAALADVADKVFTRDIFGED